MSDVNVRKPVCWKVVLCPNENLVEIWKEEQSASKMGLTPQTGDLIVWYSVFYRIKRLVQDRNPTWTVELETT